ncbi:hypothetical protein DIPPA_24973, partial [Diplonema papillatum]
MAAGDEPAEMSLEEVKQRLYDRLQAGGKLCALRAGVRKVMFQDLSRRGDAVAKGPEGKSLSQMAVDTVVLHYLKAASYHFSHSVFVSEASLTAGPHKLSLDDAHRVLSDRNTTHSCILPLLDTLRKIHQSTAVDASAQVGEQDITRLDYKLQQIDEDFRLCREQATAPSARERLRRYEEELQRESKKALAEEIERVKAGELSKMRLDEAAKYERKLTERLAELAEQDRGMQHEVQMEKFSLQARQREVEFQAVQLDKERAEHASMLKSREAMYHTLQKDLVAKQDAVSTLELQLQTTKAELRTSRDICAELQAKQAHHAAQIIRIQKQQDIETDRRAEEWAAWQREKSGIIAEYQHKMLESDLVLQNRLEELRRDFDAKERRRFGEMDAEHEAGRKTLGTDRDALKQKLEKEVRADLAAQISALQERQTEFCAAMVQAQMELEKQRSELRRSGAVSWVKRVVGTDVPSLFSFTANNRRLSTVLKVAREVEGTAEAGLRRLLGALGYTDEEAPPEGVAQWVLAWLAVASAPSATEGEFADLLRSSPKAAPPPQTPGHMPLPATPTDSTAALSPPAARRVSFAESDDPDDGDLRDCGSTEGSRGGDSDRMDRLQRQVERLTELVMAALPTRDSPRPEPVPAATTHPARDAPPGCPAPPPVAMPVGSFPAAAATPLDSCPCPAPRQGPLAGQLPPPPPLIDVSRLPQAVLLPGSSCGLLRAIEDAAPPVYRHHPYAELYQPRAEPPQPYAGSSQPLPDFPEGPPSLGEGGSVQGSPTLLSPGPELLDPQLWVGLSPIEKSLALVHIRDFFADILDAIPSVANDAQHLTNHVTTIMRLMDDTTDPDALVQLGRDTIHRMMVLKTALKAGWSLAGSLQHRHQHEAGRGAARLEAAQEAQPEAPHPTLGRSSSPRRSPGPSADERNQEQGQAVDAVNRFPPPVSGRCGRPLLSEPPLSPGERNRLVRTANAYVADALALSTRRGIHSVYRRFLEFRRHWDAEADSQLDVPTALVLFVTRLLSRGDICAASAVQYVVNVQSAEKRLGRPVDSQLVRDFVRSLKRAGAMKPSKQAVPVTKDELHLAVALEADPRVRVALALAWQGAARVDDVLTRKAEHVTESAGFWAVNWVGSKSDPFRLGQVTGVILPPAQDQELRTLLSQTPPGRLLFPDLPFRRVVTALKRANISLSGHSLRRGALFHLLRSGIDLKVIQSVSRHTTLSALMRYLPEAEVPLVRNTARAIGEALAPISSSFMNLERLTALDSRGLLRGVLDVVRSWESFRSALLPGAEEALMASAITRTTSRRMLRHFPDLVRYGVAEVASGGLRVVLPAFTVDKKSGGQRFVCDGRKLNAIMARPPPMLLPSVHEVIDRVLASSVVFLADARSYFYQFRLDADIRPYFGMHLAGPRGRFVQAQLAAMCMGWSWAPAIAQRASRVLLPEADGLPWVDNFVVVGSSLREATSRFDSFVQRCRDVNCELNEDDEQFGAPLREFDLLGLHFELSRFDRPARYRMAESWVSKLLGSPELAMVRLGGVSPRQFYRVFGSLVWFAYTTRFRLAYARCSLSFLQRLASTLASDPAAWDVTRAVPPST